MTNQTSKFIKTEKKEYLILHSSNWQMQVLNNKASIRTQETKPLYRVNTFQWNTYSFGQIIVSHVPIAWR